MKPLDEKEKPKLFAMIGLCVLVLGFGVYQFMAASAPPTTTPAGASTPKPGAEANAGGGPAAKAQAAPVPETMDPRLQALLAGPPAGGRDPFMPSGSAAPRPAPPVTQTAGLPTPPPLPQPVEKRTLMDLLKGVKPSPVGSVTAPTAVAIMPAAPAPAPSLAVSGVVMGDAETKTANVAIVRGGKGDDRRFVTVGDFVGNGYRVVAVHADGVDIEDKAGQNRQTVRIGNSGDKTRATN